MIQLYNTETGDVVTIDEEIADWLISQGEWELAGGGTPSPYRYGIGFAPDPLHPGYYVPGNATYNVTVPTFATVAALRASTSAYDLVQVAGYYAAGDGGGGTWRWDSTDTSSSHNGGTVLTSTGGLTGRWKLIHNGTLNVKQFGVTGDGTTDDTTQLQKVCDAIGVLNGGTIYFPIGAYKITSTVSIGAPCIFQGASAYASNTSRGVRIINTQTGGNAFNVTSDHVRFRDIAFTNSNAAGSLTGGAAIYFGSGDFNSVEYCRFLNNYNHVEINTGFGWFINHNRFDRAKNYSLYIKDVGAEDAGDQVVEANYFVTDMATWPTVAHIRYESGGGCKFFGNKILRAQRALDLVLADTINTSVLVVANNSMEASTVNMIRLMRGTTGNYSRCVISGNQLTADQVSASAIEINAGINDISISNNVIAGVSTAIGIHVKDGGGHIINGNNLNTFVKGIQIESPATNVQHSNNLFRNCTTAVLEIPSGISATESHNSVWEFTQTFNNVTSSTTAKNSFHVYCKDRQAFYIQVTISGQVKNGSTVVSGFVARAERVFSQNSSGANLTAVTVGTDTQAGGPIQFAFDVTTTAGDVYVGTFRNAADGGNTLFGRMTIRVIGGVNRVDPIP